MLDASKPSPAGDVSSAKRLALGTAQFGLPYGVTNSRGRIEASQVAEIVAAASSYGIDTWDTAPAYGDVEVLLGELLPAESRVVTKTALDGNRSFRQDDERALRATLERSLTRLRRQRVYGLLVHTPSHFESAGGADLARALCRVRDEGLAERVGVSVYTPTELDRIHDQFALDLYQAPLNIVDQRLVLSGALDRVVSTGAEVHVRSALLQGVLAENPHRVPAYFAAWQSLLLGLRARVLAAGVSPVGAALAFVARSAAHRVVVGVTSATELHEIVSAMAQGARGLEFDGFASDDLDLVDPRRWKGSVGK